MIERVELSTSERMVLGVLCDVWKTTRELGLDPSWTGVLRRLRRRGLATYRPPYLYQATAGRGEWASTEAGDQAMRP